MKNRTKFNWKCIYCGKRNLQMWRFQFDVPKSYASQLACRKCGKRNQIGFHLTVEVPPPEQGIGSDHGHT